MAVSGLRFIHFRVVNRSIRDNVASHFSSPPAEMGWSQSFNVYDLDELGNADFSPTRPFVFVIDAFVEPTISRVPMVIVNPIYDFKSFQLGARSGGAIELELHCFGKTKAERDDLATVLANVYDGRTTKARNIPIQTAMGNIAQTGVAEIATEPRVWWPTRGDILAAEGTLRNWAVVAFDLRIK